MNFESNFIEIVPETSSTSNRLELKTYETSFNFSGITNEELEELKVFISTHEEITSIFVRKNKLFLLVEVLDEEEAIEITKLIEGFLRSL